jgi:hypothetical protein
MIMVMGYFVNIDDTIVGTSYKKFVTQPVALDRVMNKEPYEWVELSGISNHDKKDIILFVTARWSHHEKATKRWIREKIGTDEFEIEFIPFKNKEQYVREKVLSFDRFVKYCLDKDDKELKIQVMEDDEDVIDAIVKKSIEFPTIPITIIQIRGGIPIVYHEQGKNMVMM